jgi:MFS family permease
MTRGARLFLFSVMAFGQFMALVDIQIVAASLNAIPAGLAAGPDEISWVQTAYLMVELVMIPLAGFLARALSTRWLFAASAGLLTLASALCGLAWDIDSMIAFRVFQGFGGGVDYVLEEGPRHGWFGDPGIATTAWVALVAFVLFVERSLRSATPVVRLTPFRRPTFVFASALALATSAAIFAATYLVPVFLGRVQGYNSLDIGTTVCVTGLGVLVSAPLTMRLLKHCDPRVVIVLGVLVFACSLWMFSFIGPEWGWRELFWPHVLRGVAGMLCVVPAANLALADLDDEALHQASGLFNLLRNLGGALGIALVNTWLQDHTRWHVLRACTPTAGQPGARQAGPHHRCRPRPAAGAGALRTPCTAPGAGAGLRRRLPADGVAAAGHPGAGALVPAWRAFHDLSRPRTMNRSEPANLLSVATTVPAPRWRRAAHRITR